MNNFQAVFSFRRSMLLTGVAQTKPLSRLQSLFESRGGLGWQNLFLVIVQGAIHFDDVSEANGRETSHFRLGHVTQNALAARNNDLMKPRN